MKGVLGSYNYSQFSKILPTEFSLYCKALTLFLSLVRSGNYTVDHIASIMFGQFSSITVSIACRRAWDLGLVRKIGFAETESIVLFSPNRFP